MDGSHVELSTITPSKMTTRGGQRINYNELSSGAHGRYSSNSLIMLVIFSENDDAVFRSPKSTTRGVKRKTDEAVFTPTAVGIYYILFDV